MTVKPKELGLPRKFKGFWPGQWEAIEFVAKSEAKVVLVEAPTGIGKTLIMAALQKHLNTKMLYTCSTKQLQSQVIKDFKYAVELKGRSNYHCSKDPKSFPKLSANECTKDARNCITCMYPCPTNPAKTDKQGCPCDDINEKCPCIQNCPYLIQKSIAKQADLAVLNTAFFLAEANFVGDFSGWPWIVLDEGDEMENHLMGFEKVSITQRQIDRLKIGPPSKKTVAEAWIEWMVLKAIPAIYQRIRALDPASPVDQRERQQLGRLVRRYEFLSTQDMSKWVFYPDEKSWDFKPVFIAPFAESDIWKHGERFLMMSASFLSKKHRAQQLGLKDSQVDIIRLDSPFPPENRPIFFVASANMTNKNKAEAWPQAIETMDDLLDDHIAEKGIIHSVSYPLTQFVMENSRHHARLMTHDTRNRIKVLEDFKKSPTNEVLVSPSMSRGVDLPGDQARFSIILKAPFPYLGDPQISRRLYSTGREGEIWYAMQAIAEIIQMTGRIVRYVGDWGICYIIDVQFNRLFNDNRWLFPDWWQAGLISAPKKDDYEWWRERAKLLRGKV